MRSSTETELVAIDNMAAKIVWVKNLLLAQGQDANFCLHQDNQSTILLEEKGMGSVGKRSRHIKFVASSSKIWWRGVSSK